MMISISGKQVYYSTKGTGKPFIFIHGWGGSHASLTLLSDLFSKTHTVYLIDLPGFGKSEQPDPNWGSFQYADVLIQCIKKLKLQNPIYFGHSFGGSLGIIISATEPNLISKLILCNSSFKRTNKKSRTASSLKSIFYSIPLLSLIGPLLRWIGYAVFFRNSDLYRFPHLESNFKKIISEDLSPLLDKIKVKTLILWGNLDTQTPVSLAYQLKNNIKNAELIIYPNIKHNLPIRYPDLVAQSIIQFLKS